MVEKHRDATVYTVWVLWLIGMSERGVGMVAGLGKKQVAGIVTRSPYSNRSKMSDAERREKLDELWGIRSEGGEPIDGGILDPLRDSFLPLRGRQRKGK